MQLLGSCHFEQCYTMFKIPEGQYWRRYLVFLLIRMYVILLSCSYPVFLFELYHIVSVYHTMFSIHIIRYVLTPVGGLFIQGFVTCPIQTLGTIFSSAGTVWCFAGTVLVFQELYLGLRQ